MNILAIDDENIALEGLCAQLRVVAPNAAVYGFSNGEEALSFAPASPYNIAFLDIQMGGMDGLTLAKMLVLRYPRLNIIFITGYHEYASKAFSLYASGYIMKPATPEKLRRELENLRYPLSSVLPCRIHARTFGNFELFIDGEPIHFRYRKTHELVAYLVDRNGALCTNGELISILWEDSDSAQHISYLKNLRTDLISTLKQHGCEEVILRQRGRLGIATGKIDCDYYRWLQGDNQGANTYRGEYMAQYSWSEFTLKKL